MNVVETYDLEMDRVFPHYRLETLAWSYRFYRKLPCKVTIGVFWQKKIAPSLEGLQEITLLQEVAQIFNLEYWMKAALSRTPQQAKRVQELLENYPGILPIVRKQVTAKSQQSLVPYSNEVYFRYLP